MWQVFSKQVALFQQLVPGSQWVGCVLTRPWWDIWSLGLALRSTLLLSTLCEKPPRLTCRGRPGNSSSHLLALAHFRSCALRLGPTERSGEHGCFPLTLSDANAEAVHEKATSSPSLQKDFASNSASSEWFWSQIPARLGKGRIQKKQKCHRRGYNPDDDYSRQHTAEGVRKNTCLCKIVTTSLFWKIFSLHVFCCAQAHWWAA